MSKEHLKGNGMSEALWIVVPPNVVGWEPKLIASEKNDPNEKASEDN